MKQKKKTLDASMFFPVYWKYGVFQSYQGKLWKAIRDVRIFVLHTLLKFRRYNKASLGELVPLEILGKHQQGLPRGVSCCVAIYWMTIIC